MIYRPRFHVAKGLLHLIETALMAIKAREVEPCPRTAVAGFDSSTVFAFSACKIFILLGKARFWDKHASASFNSRQREMIDRLFDGFIGKLTTSK